MRDARLFLDDIIWDVVQNKLEDLRTACLDLLGEE